MLRIKSLRTEGRGLSFWYMNRLNVSRFKTSAFGCDLQFCRWVGRISARECGMDGWGISWERSWRSRKSVWAASEPIWLSASEQGLCADHPTVSGCLNQKWMTFEKFLLKVETRRCFLSMKCLQGSSTNLNFSGKIMPC